MKRRAPRSGSLVTPPADTEVDASEVLDLDTSFGLSAFGSEQPGNAVTTTPAPEPARPLVSDNVQEGSPAHPVPPTPSRRMDIAAHEPAVHAASQDVGHARSGLARNGLARNVRHGLPVRRSTSVRPHSRPLPSSDTTGSRAQRLHRGGVIGLGPVCDGSSGARAPGECRVAAASFIPGGRHLGRADHQLDARMERASSSAARTAAAPHFP